MEHKYSIGIDAIAYSLGESLVTNEQLQKENPSWDMSKTVERTGVYSRPVALPETTALDLGYQASLAVLNDHNLLVEDVDALIFCTQTPDHIVPPNSTLLHGRLKMGHHVMAFDISHACSGFMYSLGIARSLVASGAAKKVLVVTADTYSRLIHPEDRSIRPLFGDGAAASIVSAGEPRLRVLDMSFGTAGKHADRFIIQNGGCRNPNKSSPTQVALDRSGRINSPDHIHMDGLGVLSFFNHAIPAAVREIVRRNGKSLDDVSLFVFHQASRLALQGIAKSLGISGDRVLEDMVSTGNLVSSSIPVILAGVLAQRKLPRGSLILLSGFGVGLSWSTALIET
jgi:3-oxoacyl-[acyl-carrier-protein] synthase-3